MRLLCAAFPRSARAETPQRHAALQYLEAVERINPGRARPPPWWRPKKFYGANEVTLPRHWGPRLQR
jgi:hypothetical protein